MYQVETQFRKTALGQAYFADNVPGDLLTRAPVRMAELFYWLQEPLLYKGGFPCSSPQEGQSMRYFKLSLLVREQRYCKGSSLNLQMGPCSLLLRIDWGSKWGACLAKALFNLFMHYIFISENLLPVESPMLSFLLTSAMRFTKWSDNMW